MNRRACYYFKNLQELKDFLSVYEQEFLQFTNKYRVCIFIEDEFFKTTEEFILHFNYNFIIKIHEVYSQFLTYDNDTEKNISSPFIESRRLSFWVHDIDSWIHFPPLLHKKIKKLGSHVGIYESLQAIKAPP